MTTRFAIALLIWMMVQAVMFGIGAILVLATPLREQAMLLLPMVVAASSFLAIPMAWWIAPRLRGRYGRAQLSG